MFITKEISSKESYNSSSYEDLINFYKLVWPEIVHNFSLKIPVQCWIKEALEIVEKVNSLLKDKKNLENYLKDNEFKWKVTSSIITLTEFHFVVSNLDVFKQENTYELYRKLSDVVKMPLLVREEDATTSTNQGRNSLFELRLYIRFALAGFDVVLQEHPDILVKVNEREYAVECKRVFTEETFIKNCERARDQIKKYSLTKRQRLGIIAISVTRAFHSGDLKLVTSTVKKASDTVSYYMDLLYKNNAKALSDLLDYKFPALLLDYSDICEVDTPIWIHKVSLYKLVSSNRVINDLKPLEKSFS
jgi:hypothetical protein